MTPTITMKDFSEISEVPDIATLMRAAKWLEGKTLVQITKEIKRSDALSRVTTKGDVGYVIENGYFKIKKNSEAKPDVEHLGVEIKTCPLKYNKERNRLSVKEPLSLNIVNYFDEVKNKDITESSLYHKNKRILFVFYVHDLKKKRSDYEIKYVFLWGMDNNVLDELRPDYKIIIDKIRVGEATDLHQKYNQYLTTCPKHCGDFKDPNCKISKTKQPFSTELAERRAFRLKVKYMNMIVSKYLNRPLVKGG